MTLGDHISISAWFMATMAGLVLAFCGTGLEIQLIGLFIATIATLVFVESGTFKAISRKLKDNS